MEYDFIWRQMAISWDGDWYIYDYNCKPKSNFKYYHIVG